MDFMLIVFVQIPFKFFTLKLYNLHICYANEDKADFIKFHIKVISVCAEKVHKVL